MNLNLEAVGRSHVGLVRKRNEDTIYVGESLFAVADGLGGHPAGDVASATAIEALHAYDRSVEPGDLADHLARAVKAANDALGRKIAAEPALRGMGTTLVALLRSGETAVLANVGDCRAYLHREGHTTRLTEDHTYEHLLADAEDFPDLPERLARWLDGRPDGRSPDLTTKTLCPGDRFLLCSDGLSSYVTPEAIDRTLQSTKDPEQAADQLVELALNNGGPDNISTVVIDVRD